GLREERGGDDEQRERDDDGPHGEIMKSSSLRVVESSRSSARRLDDLTTRRLDRYPRIAPQSDYAFAVVDGDEEAGEEAVADAGLRDVCVPHVDRSEVAAGDGHVCVAAC